MFTTMTSPAIPPLKIKIMLESNLLKPTMLVGGLGVVTDL